MVQKLFQSQKVVCREKIRASFDFKSDQKLKANIIVLFFQRIMLFIGDPIYNVEQIIYSIINKILLHCGLIFKNTIILK